MDASMATTMTIWLSLPICGMRMTAISEPMKAPKPWKPSTARLVTPLFSE